MFHLHSRDLDGLVATPSVIRGFEHEWRVYIPLKGIEYEEGNAPPPFEAYGKNCHFVLEKCLLKGCKQCYSHTIKEAEKEIEHRDAIFSNYSVLFGIKRNKTLSIQVKKNKLQEMETESSSEEEQEALDEAGGEEAEDEEEEAIDEENSIPEEDDESVEENEDLEEEEEEDDE